jgi:hypothetical protein
MRRWVCIIALLFGFAGDSYAWTARPRIPVAIERTLVDAPERDGATTAWWLRH